MVIRRRVTARNFSPFGIIEDKSEGLPVAAIRNQPRSDVTVVARCLNIAEQPIKLNAGSMIGTFGGMEANQVDEHSLGTAFEVNQADIEFTGSRMKLEHFQNLYTAARGTCHWLGDIGNLLGC